MAKKKSKKKTSRKRSGLLTKLVVLMAVFVLFVLCGYLETDGRTLLQHADRALGVDWFQPGHGRLVAFLGGLRTKAPDLSDIKKEIRKHGEKKGEKKTTPSGKNAGDGKIVKPESKDNPVVTVKRPSGKVIKKLKEDRPMDRLTEKDKAGLDKIFEENVGDEP